MQLLTAKIALALIFLAEIPFELIGSIDGIYPLFESNTCLVWTKQVHRFNIIQVERINLILRIHVIICLSALNGFAKKNNKV